MSLTFDDITDSLTVEAQLRKVSLDTALKLAQGAALDNLAADPESQNPAPAREDPVPSPHGPRAGSPVPPRPYG